MVITLIGFRGTGKSRVAPLLAARLGWRTVDADAEIVRTAGQSIPEIFAAAGEPEFRRLEVGVLARLLGEDRLVVAAGGGAILDPETRQRMRTAGPVVWLKASLETIWSRIGRDLGTGGNRPALTGHDPRTEIELLCQQREPLYAETATIVVDTDQRTPPEVVEAVLQQLPPLPGRPACP